MVLYAGLVLCFFLSCMFSLWAKHDSIWKWYCLLMCHFNFLLNISEVLRWILSLGAKSYFPFLAFTVDLASNQNKLFYLKKRFDFTLHELLLQSLNWISIPIQNKLHEDDFYTSHPLKSLSFISKPLGWKKIFYIS